MLAILKKKNLIFIICKIFVCGSNILLGIDISEISYNGIHFQVQKNGLSNTNYIVIHGDEETAKMLIKDHIKTNLGKAFIIKSKNREVTLGPTIVDPNRIFSKSGARKALKNFKTDWDPNELNKLLLNLEKNRNDFLFNIFPSEGGLLIALHNNFRGYNVNDELKNSQLYSIKNNQNPRDFILCTDIKDYEKLKNGPYNIVLQSKVETNNNGSLSWAALEHGVRYINIETRLGWLSQQKKMLYFVERLIK